MKGRLALWPSLAQWFHFCLSQLTKDCLLSHLVIIHLVGLDSAGSFQQLFHCSVLSRGKSRYVKIYIYICIHTQTWNLSFSSLASWVTLLYKQVVICFVLLGRHNFLSFFCVVHSSNNHFMPTQKNIKFPGRQGVQSPVWCCWNRHCKLCSAGSFQKRCVT